MKPFTRRAVRDSASGWTGLIVAALALVAAGCGSSSSDPGGPCGTDCSLVVTQNPCLVSVCNEGQYPGSVGACVVVNVPNGDPCDDGLFCTGQNAAGSTGGDTCTNGACTAGTSNSCAQTAGDCVTIGCSEAGQTCTAIAANEGGSCDELQACETGGVCTSGLCVGVPIDCSPLTSGCMVGVCNSGSGACEAVPGPAGVSCLAGLGDCQVGTCLADGACGVTNLPAGTGCNDHQACTDNDVCDPFGICVGTATPGCVALFEESFDGVCPPSGWDLSGEWQCGVPTSGPPAARSGTQCIATRLDGNYSNSQPWGTAAATSPPIDLTTATSPQLTWSVWIHTEGSVFDGTNLKVSADGGTSWLIVTAVTPPYSLTVNTEPAWGGNLASLGWQVFQADLTAYAGQVVQIRFDFRSDGSIVYPGVYVDDVALFD